VCVSKHVASPFETALLRLLRVRIERRPHSGGCSDSGSAAGSGAASGLLSATLALPALTICTRRFSSARGSSLFFSCSSPKPMTESWPLSTW